MPRYRVAVTTPMPPSESFGYMADLTNFARWDPGVRAARQVHGDEPGIGSAYDIDVVGVVGSLTLRYEVTAFDEPTRFVARARSALLTSVDTISVEGDGDGSIVIYDADLTFNGLLGVANPVLGIAFTIIGDRAASGLTRALGGERVAT